MSYQVFRVYRGSVLHIIHETLTGRNKTNGVYVLCKVEPFAGERDRGTPTCPECIRMDDPCDLTAGEKNVLTRIIAKDPSLTSMTWGSQAITSLHRKDLITKDVKLTRRGRILALDYTEGPAPAAAVSGIVHARTPLCNSPRCGDAGVLDGFEAMTVEKYARIRALELHITCVHCAMMSIR
jgi:hypothetical protein